MWISLNKTMKIYYKMYISDYFNHKKLRQQKQTFSQRFMVRRKVKTCVSNPLQQCLKQPQNIPQKQTNRVYISS